MQNNSCTFSLQKFGRGLIKINQNRRDSSIYIIEFVCTRSLQITHICDEFEENREMKHTAN